MLAEGKGRVGLVGSETGIIDVQDMSRKMGCQVEFATAHVGVREWRELLRGATEMAARTDAICLVRGGGDPLEFAVWDEPKFVLGLMELGKPIFVAVGHANYEPTLADLRADESFGTPSAFGATYAVAWKWAEGVRGESEASQRRLERVQQSNEELRAIVGVEQGLRRRVEEELRVMGARRAGARRAMWVSVAVAAVLLLVLVALLVWR